MLLYYYYLQSHLHLQQECNSLSLILLGHGVAPVGMFYADRHKGWMNAPIIGRGVGCGEWVGPEIVACVVC
jgi:hypothetical protein